MLLGRSSLAIFFFLSKPNYGPYYFGAVLSVLKPSQAFRPPKVPLALLVHKEQTGAAGAGNSTLVDCRNVVVLSRLGAD